MGPGHGQSLVYSSPSPSPAPVVPSTTNKTKSLNKNLLLAGGLIVGGVIWFVHRKFSSQDISDQHPKDDSPEMCDLQGMENIFEIILTFCPKNQSNWSSMTFLLYGVSGVGKTTFGEVLGRFFERASHGTFIKREAQELSSAEDVDAMFNATLKAQRPTLLMIDDADLVIKCRNDDDSPEDQAKLASFNQRINLITQRGIAILLVTNRPWDLDPVSLSYIPILLYQDLPSRDVRKSILQNRVKNIQTNLTEDQFNQLADEADGYSGRDLMSVCELAANVANASNEPMTHKHVRQALDWCHKTTEDEDLQKIRQWRANHHPQ